MNWISFKWNVNYSVLTYDQLIALIEVAVDVAAAADVAVVVAVAAAIYFLAQSMELKSVVHVVIVNYKCYQHLVLVDRKENRKQRSKTLVRNNLIDTRVTQVVFFLFFSSLESLPLLVASRFRCRCRPVHLLAHRQIAAHTGTR